MKILAKIIVVLVILLVVVVVAVAFYLDAIAKGAIERGATYALGVKTTLDKADVGVISGEFSMAGLTVANPEGFQSDRFLRLDEGSVNVSLGSLRQDTVELPLLTLNTVNMTLEKKGGESNYKVILGNLKRFESGGGTPSDTAKKPSKEFVIREVVISDINVDVELFNLAGVSSRAQLPIDEIRLTNVGADGADTAEVTNVIIKAILAAVLANAGNLPADLINDLNGSMQGLTSLADMGIRESIELGDKATEAARKALDDAAKQADQAIEDATQRLGDEAVKGLGDLLGGKKD